MDLVVIAVPESQYIRSLIFSIVLWCAFQKGQWYKHMEVKWWRRQVEIFSVLLALCEGNPPVTGGFPSQMPVTRKFNVFFDLRLDKRLNKQSRRWWFETPSRSYWRWCNENFSISCSSWDIAKNNQFTNRGIVHRTDLLKRQWWMNAHPHKVWHMITHGFPYFNACLSSHIYCFMLDIMNSLWPRRSR